MGRKLVVFETAAENELLIDPDSVCGVLQPNYNPWQCLLLLRGTPALDGAVMLNHPVEYVARSLGLSVLKPQTGERMTRMTRKMHSFVTSYGADRPSATAETQTDRRASIDLTEVVGFEEVANLVAGKPRLMLFMRGGGSTTVYCDHDTMVSLMEDA